MRIAPIPTEEDAVLAATKAAMKLAPPIKPPPNPISRISGQPEWHSFESDAWSIGEGIRQALKTKPKLRKSVSIQLALLSVIDQRALGRGRESFFFSLGHVAAAPHSAKVARYLTDIEVQGHALDALLRMKAFGYAQAVKPLLESRHTWIRNLAKKYIERHRSVA